MTTYVRQAVQWEPAHGAQEGSILSFDMLTGSVWASEALVNAAIAKVLPGYARHPARVRIRDREWRARERAANAKPLSDKVSSRGGRVAEGVKAKPRGKSK